VANRCQKNIITVVLGEWRGKGLIVHTAGGVGSCSSTTEFSHFFVPDSSAEVRDRRDDILVLNNTPTVW
jgi:hypothetical protein